MSLARSIRAGDEGKSRARGEGGEESGEGEGEKGDEGGKGLPEKDLVINRTIHLKITRTHTLPDNTGSYKIRIWT